MHRSWTACPGNLAPFDPSAHVFLSEIDIAANAAPEALMVFDCGFGVSCPAASSGPQGVNLEMILQGPKT